MADLIVSPVIDLVMQRLVAYLDDRIELHTDVEEKLKKLERVLNRIRPVANTAEEVDLEKHKDLKPWMRDLKLAVEEANDVVDEFEYLRLKRQVEEVRSAASPSSGKRGIASCILIPSCCYNYANKIIMIPSTDLLKRLRAVQSKLEELDSRASQFLQLVDDRKATDRERHNQDVRKRETSSSVVERELVGRRKKMLEEIISKLLEEEEHISVIAVVGHGGMGKTTLAQHIFNDTRVEPHFQVRMWAHVSQVFDVSTLTKKIMESATRTTHTDSSLEMLQQKLKDVLKSKRFLLVLDDVWYSQLNGPVAMEEEWNKLCSPLSEACGKGSKILLTSRTPEVDKLPTGALMPTIISLQGLAPDECWSIMQTSAFRGGEIPDGYRDLVEIGKQIAFKVHGSPLAAKAVGGILRKELSLRHWSSILNTEFSELPGSDIIMAVLTLSYQYLPPHLRQCFAYCSLFPKGHIFDVEMLIRMWVAHGYIRDRPQGEKTEEDMGKIYFEDLLSAGFFTRATERVMLNLTQWDEIVMHDLMNDLAQFVTRDEILRIEKDAQYYCPIPKNVRHLSVTTDYLAELSKNKCNLSHLESFLIFHSYVDLDKKLVKEVLQQLRRVRVLYLCDVEELSDDISHWVHLRYLDVSKTNLDRLPDSLMILYHLQVLSIKKHSPLDIRSLEKLNNLVNLRFLYIADAQCLNLTCIRGLNSLQLVDILHLQEGRGSEIRNLKALNDLRGVLRLKNLHYIESVAATMEAELSRKNRLQELRLQWGGECSPGVATEVLQALQPPKSLEELYIDSYPGMVCPSWMSIPVLENLTSIELSNLFHLECIPPLGQQLPFLQRLKLKILPRVRKLSLEGEGFPSLKYLTIERMEELEEWSVPDGSGGLPCLEEFKITECPKMKMLPTLSLTLSILSIEDVGISTLPVLVVDQGIISNSGSSSSGITSFSSKLSDLRIQNCGNLTSLREGLLQNQQRLTHLKFLTVRLCKMLESLPDGGFQEVKSLRILIIGDCPNLTWAAPRPREDVDRGLLPSSLEELRISHIDDNALSRCLQGLSRLSYLVIGWCPCLKAILVPEEEQGNCLKSLQALSISSCQALTPSGLKESLHALPSLKELYIVGCPGLLVVTSSISAAADDGEVTAIGPPCPLALEYLMIDDPQMLVNVPVLKSLTSVQEVYISDASRLIYFSPDLEEWLLQNGTSLRQLTISQPQQLRSLPKLPDSLKELIIWDADPEFKKRYERDTGCDWYKIRHIKYIVIS